MVEPRPKYMPIGQVSRAINVEAHVIRYWQTKFGAWVKPKRSQSGHRYFKKQDIEALETIKILLWGLGFTIDGARLFLKSGEGLCPDCRASIMQTVRAMQGATNERP